MEHYRVLVVDDDGTIRKMLAKYLAHLGYEVESASDTGEAISHIEQAFFDVVLTDVRMPGSDGMELLSWMSAHRKETAVVMLSGCDDVKLAVRAMKAGALDYIVKPFQLKDVADVLGRAIGNHKQALERAVYLRGLESTLEQQSGELQATLHQLKEASQETLEALTSALDVREKETHSHSKRVSEYSVHLASELGVAKPDLEVIRQGSMLHDIGKIGIPDRILLKPDRLNEEEWVEMRKHPEIGSWIVNGVESLQPSAGIVIAHHERFDGSGYPHGLREDQIPLGARVFALADTLDAVLSDRPYRAGQSYEHARREVEQNRGTQFDPEVSDCFLRVPPRAWEQIRERTLPNNSRHLVLT